MDGSCATAQNRARYAQDCITQCVLNHCSFDHLALTVYIEHHMAPLLFSEANGLRKEGIETSDNAHLS